MRFFRRHAAAAGLWCAGRLPSPPGTFLRTADAIHLIAAMGLGETDVLTYGRRQDRRVATDRLRATVVHAENPPNLLVCLSGASG